MRTVRFVALLAILAAGTAHALDPRKALSQYGLESWKPKRGVANGGILCIAQSSDGYLWMGTRRGLFRFNGVEFQLFDRANSGGLIGWNVYHIEPRKDGSLLFSTEGGAGLVELRNGKFSAYSAPGLPHLSIRVFHEGRDGTLWIGTTSSGLLRISNGKAKTFAQPEGVGNNVKAIAEAHDGSVWIATYGDGISRIQGERVTRYGTRQGLPSNDVRAILEDPDGTLWFSTLAGLAHLRDGKFKVYSRNDGLSHDRVFPLLRDRAGNLWIGTEGGGLNRLADGHFAVLAPTESLRSDEIRAVFEDRERNLWFGGAEGTLYRLKDEKFTVFTRQEGLSSDLIRTVFEDRARGIWIGTANGVDELRDGRVSSPHTGWATRAVTTFIQDHTGDFWIGTLGDGLRWDHSGLGRVFFPGQRITVLLEDRNGTVWAGLTPGLVRIRDGRAERTGTGTPLEAARIVALTEDAQGTVWAAEGTGALYRIDGVKTETYSLPSGGCPAGVTSLHLDSAGALWIGTSEGLCRFQAGAFQHFSIDDGLAENQVNSILEDDREFLWLSGYEGFSRVPKAALSAYRRGTSQRLPVWFLERANGRPTSSGLQRSSALKAHDGRLWFASLRGLIMLDPSTAHPDSTPIPTVIEQVLADRSPLAATLQPKLAAGVRDIEFRFVGISLGDPASVKFKYQLEGYDTGWTDAGTRREAFYTNLPSGPYRFRVLAANGDGLWNESATTFSFEKDAHFYQTWWMRLILAAFLATSGYLAYRARVSGLSARYEAVLSERNRIARELHDTVEQGLTGVMLQLDTVAAHWSNSPGRARHGLDLARNMARHCMGEARAAVRDLRSASLDPGDAVKALRQMAVEFGAAGAPEIHVEVLGEQCPLTRNVEMTLLRIGQEALTNAIKHAHATRIDLEVRFAPSDVGLRVRDDGVGFSSESSLVTALSGHFGLLGMRERANKVGGRLVIESTQGGGTTIDFQIPQGAHRA